MPRLVWEQMLEKYPADFLVVGVVDGSPARSADFLGKLLKVMQPQGDYSFQLLKEGDGYAAHIVFAVASDGSTFATSVGAKRTNRYPGWKSQRLFMLDEEWRRTMRHALQSSPR